MDHAHSEGDDDRKLVCFTFTKVSKRTWIPHDGGRPVPCRNYSALTIDARMGDSCSQSYLLLAYH